MWIDRDFSPIDSGRRAHPLKILKGPRQVGKTALLERLPDHRVVYLDDLATRELATSDPRFFLDHIEGPVVLDEASLAPPLFPELKRRVDETRRSGSASTLDV
jgi:predicted AAA+ superfamily ATPase